MRADSRTPIGPVLIVEDNADTRAAMVELFRGSGYRVLEAENGRAALDLLLAATERPSIIVLDLLMPVMDGVEFRGELLRRHPDLASIPVLIVSAFADPHDVAELAAADRVGKPIDCDRLLALIERYGLRAAA